jgi:hypothetical protein
MPLYHYTDAGGFLGIIDTRTLWATHFRHLNDREEFLAGERLIEDEAKNLISTLGSKTQRWFVENLLAYHEVKSLSQIADAFIASLSEHGDQLSQWRGYGGGAAGYSIGLTPEKLPLPKVDDDRPDADLALFFVKCIYDEEDYRARVRHELTDVARGFEKFAQETVASTIELATKPDLAKTFTGAAIGIAMRRIAAFVPRYKVEAFKEEREWRLVAIPMRGKEKKVIKLRTSGTSILPYLPIALCEDDELIGLTRVLLGPTIDPQVGKNGARMLLKNYGYDPELVGQSSIPFRG